MARLLTSNAALANQPIMVEPKEYPLYLAALCGRAKIIQCLLEHGADSNAPNDHKRTPLHGAAERNKRQAAEALLRGGAKVDALDDEWHTPLHLAVFNGAASVSSLLLNHGATVDIYAAACMLDTAAVRAVIARNRSVVKEAPYSEQILADTCTMIMESSNRKRRSEFMEEFRLHEQLLRALIDSDAPTGLNFCRFAVTDTPEIVSYLISLGADPGQPTSDGKLPIEAAREAGNDNLVKLLREHGCR